MKFIFKKVSIVFLFVLFLASCTAHKNIPYVEGAASLSEADLLRTAKKFEAVIMSKDILSITVNSPTGAASRDFNLPLMPHGSDNIVQTTVNSSSSAGNTGSLQNYIVDNDGYISFPVLGRLKIGGLTKREAEKKIYDLIYPEYLKEEPIVNIRFLNYRVSVLGEVAKPGIYSSPNEQITLFEALAMAGDLTIYGNRKNVLIIRELDNGMKDIRQINLQDKNILLDNEVYFLRQNDEVYIQPNKARGNNSSIGSLESMALSGISLLISVISIITR